MHHGAGGPNLGKDKPEEAAMSEEDQNRLLRGYEHMLRRLREMMADTDALTRPNLVDAIDTAEEEVVESGQLERDEADRIGGYLWRDLSAAAEPYRQVLEQAAEQSLEGDLDGATALAMAAKARWERQHQGTATVADHNPMDDVDRLFAQMEVYAKAQEAPHFAACCVELAQLLQATADAHRFSWWNVL